MTRKRAGLLASGVLTAGLLLWGNGLVLAGDPTPAPTPGVVGPGMMGGQGGMMGDQGGMMGDQGSGQMDAAHLGQMQAMHAAMGQDGNCDPAQMETMHRSMQGTASPTP